MNIARMPQSIQILLLLYCPLLLLLYCPIFVVTLSFLRLVASSRQVTRELKRTITFFFFKRTMMLVDIFRSYNPAYCVVLLMLWTRHVDTVVFVPTELRGRAAAPYWAGVEEPETYTRTGRHQTADPRRRLSPWQLPCHQTVCVFDMTRGVTSL